MKGRINAVVLWLVAVNLVAACAVFVLAYMAGANSGGKMLWQVRQLHSGALYMLLCAAAALVGGSMFVFFLLCNTVCAPMQTLTAFAEQTSEGNFDVRLEEVGGGTFGYINLHLNEAAARAAKALKGAGAKQQAPESADDIAAVLRQVCDAADNTSTSAKQILSASEALAAIARKQVREIAKPSSTTESVASTSAEQKRPAATSLAATVAAAMQPAVVAPPVSIPGAQITGVIELPIASPAADAEKLRQELERLTEELAQMTKDCVSEGEGSKG